jgi:predicted RNase H-like HicB family nuclease
MDEKLIKQATELADRPYTILVSVETTATGQSIYLAKNPELIGCMAQGETLDEARKNLRDARIDYIYDSLLSNDIIPEPRVQQPESPIVTTADNATHVPTAKLKVETFAQRNVPDQPITHHLHQYSET